MPAADLALDIARIVAERGGVLLTEGRPRAGVPLRLRCAADHVFDLAADRVVAGRWCPTCARFRHDIADMRAEAKRRGGVCLSPVYRGTLEPLEWRCAAGHVFRSTPNTVFGGSWCRVCALGMHTLARLRAIANLNGGVCLATEDTLSTVPVPWRCAAGHEWRAPSKNVVGRRTWCPRCMPSAKLDLGTFVDIARERGGVCLSKRYGSTGSVLRFRCARGHEFATRASNVRAGHWCPECSGTAKGSVAKMRAIAAERGGAFVSRSYANASTKHRWRCAQGHEWDAAPSHVVHGSWCPHCAGSAQATIQQMQAIARERGGTCLSTRYCKSRLPLRWRCGEGHIFDATPAAVRAGRWCLVCKRSAARA